MTKPKITEGEWRTYNAQKGRILKNWSVCDSRACRIAKIEEMPGQSGDEEAANARAIAAVPELLAALEGLLADKYLADPINADRMAPAKAALAKAGYTF